MENRTIVLTLQEYLNAVNFMNLGRKDQVAYLVYYITHIAKLRGDMIPSVIADRINDQVLIENKTYNRQIDPVSVDAIKAILEDNPDYFTPSSTVDKKQFDRQNQTQTSYVLAKEMCDKLSKEFDTDIAGIRVKLKRKSRIEWIFFAMLGCCVVSLILSFQMGDRSLAPRLSWVDYVKYTQLKNVDCKEQCLYILYHITEVTHLNDYMTPQTLQGRIKSMGNDGVDAEYIRTFLKQSDDVRLVDSENEGYALSEKGKLQVEEKINENYKSKNVITARWIFNNLPVEGFLSIGMIFCSVIGIGVLMGKIHSAI